MAVSMDDCNGIFKAVLLIVMNLRGRRGARGAFAQKENYGLFSRNSKSTFVFHNSCQNMMLFSSVYETGLGSSPVKISSD